MKTREPKKKVCVTIPRAEHERLVRMAGETGRTPAGYLRWLLHAHFRDLDKNETAGA